jgi:hypothetical protein
MFYEDCRWNKLTRQWRMGQANLVIAGEWAWWRKGFERKSILEVTVYFPNH